MAAELQILTQDLLRAQNNRRTEGFRQHARDSFHGTHVELQQHTTKVILTDDKIGKFIAIQVARIL